LCIDRITDQGLPPILSLEAWAARQGRTTDAAVHGHIHAGLRSAPTTKTYKRWNERELSRLQNASDETKRLYAAAVARGEIRSPQSLSRRERLELTAAGHPDNPSVQAARRILAQMQGTSVQPTGGAGTESVVVDGVPEIAEAVRLGRSP